MFCGSDSPAKSNEFGKGHLPVLLWEVLGLFASSDQKTYLDATFGGGGHTRALLESGPTVSVVAIDCDPEAAERAHALTEMFPGRVGVFFFYF
jgi:16S rRNA (cytosine1402-N4)-methyltransferase